MEKLRSGSIDRVAGLTSKGRSLSGTTDESRQREIIEATRSPKPALRSTFDYLLESLALCGVAMHGAQLYSGEALETITRAYEGHSFVSEPAKPRGERPERGGSGSKGIAPPDRWNWLRLLWRATVSLWTGR
jgi:hypothetical protein